jgi:DNA-binding NtrC family response regulator
MRTMIRPCYLVIDREFPGSISTRKLVIETAKFNVLTAYSGVEARETFRRFPNVSGVVLDAGLHDVPCTEIVHEIKQVQPKLPVIVICAPGDIDCPDADFILESFEPAKLLEILRKLTPAASDLIEKKNEDLSHKQLY